jgi:hypothetical protein
VVVAALESTVVGSRVTVACEVVEEGTGAVGGASDGAVGGGWVGDGGVGCAACGGGCCVCVGCEGLGS